MGFAVLIIILEGQFIALEDSGWERFGGSKVLAGRLDSGRLAP